MPARAFNVLIEQLEEKPRLANGRFGPVELCRGSDKDTDLVRLNALFAALSKPSSNIGCFLICCRTA